MITTTDRLLLRVPEAAALLGLSRAKFYAEIQRGAIRTVRIGTAVRVSVDDLRDYVERLKSAAPRGGGAVTTLRPAQGVRTSTAILLLNVAPPGREHDFVRNSELDAVQRAYLAQFTTPRRALDGSIAWPLDELGAEQ